MTLSEWLYIIGITITILCLLFSIVSLVNFLVLGKKKKKLPRRRPKNPKKRKKLARQRKLLEAKYKRARTLFLVFLVFGAATGGGTFYFRQYQSMNLTTEDADAIVQSYYLLRDFKEQLAVAQEGQEDQVKVEQNIQYLSRNMASYGTKQASDLNTEEGQLALNRYYTAIMELGQNANVNFRSFYGSPEQVAEYLETVEKIQKNYEAPVFEYYKVDEAALKEE